MMKKWINSDIVSGVLVVIISFFFLSMTNDMSEGAARFPKIILKLLLILGISLTIIGIKRSMSCKFGVKASILNFSSLKNPLIAFVLIAIYVFLLKILGFYIATSLFVAIYMLFYRENKFRIIILAVICINIFVFFLFEVQLNSQLPKGIFNFIERLV